MARKYPEGYYVYLHRRKSDGKVFYVGKGRDGRGWHKLSSQRSNWWINVATKHGFNVEVVRGGLTNDQALHIEEVLIYGFRFFGHPLVNLTNGGEGTEGYRKTGSKVVYTSLCETYQSVTDAVLHLKGNGYRLATDGGIISCLNGRQSSAYGRSWSYIGFPEHPALTGREANNAACIEANRKMVFSNLGEKFSSASEAARAMREIGFEKASQGRISSAARGKSNTAYGRSWWYEGCDPKPYIDPMKEQSSRQKVPVVMDGHIRHDSMKDAAEWLRANGNPKAKHSDISAVVNGRRNIAYGHTWKYADDTTT